MMKPSLSFGGRLPVGGRRLRASGGRASQGRRCASRLHRGVDQRRRRGSRQRRHQSAPAAEARGHGQDRRLPGPGRSGWRNTWRLVPGDRHAGLDAGFGRLSNGDRPAPRPDHHPLRSPYRTAAHLFRRAQRRRRRPRARTATAIPPAIGRATPWWWRPTTWSSRWTSGSPTRIRPPSSSVTTSSRSRDVEGHRVLVADMTHDRSRNRLHRPGDGPEAMGPDPERAAAALRMSPKTAGASTSRRWRRPKGVCLSRREALDAGSPGETSTRGDRHHRQVSVVAIASGRRPCPRLGGRRLRAPLLGGAVRFQQVRADARAWSRSSSRSNPHMRMTLVVTNGPRASMTVELEGHSTNNMYRMGYRRGMINVGDTITVNLAPLRNRATGAAICTVSAVTAKGVFFEHEADLASGRRRGGQDRQGRGQVGPRSRSPSAFKDFQEEQVPVPRDHSQPRRFDPGFGLAAGAAAFASVRRHGERGRRRPRPQRGEQLPGGTWASIAKLPCPT